MEDLQQRVDASHEARILTALDRSQHKSDGPGPPQLVWPRALRECLADDERLRSIPLPADTGGLDTPAFWRRRQEADLVHRLLGLIS